MVEEEEECRKLKTNNYGWNSTTGWPLVYYKLRLDSIALMFN